LADPTSYEWDEAKHERNIEVRGFGFEVAIAVLAGHVVRWKDIRRDYGETRMIAVGSLRDRSFTIV